MSFIPWWVHYPNVNNEILNLDWLLKVSNCNTHKIENFINLNTIKYADPILWNITSQYEANTVVVDGQTGNAYISTKAVPSGVHLNRTEYWTQIYNYADALGDLRSQIAFDEGNTTTASKPFAVGDLVFVKELLYRVIAPMIAGNSFVVDSNVVKTTIDEELKREALARIEEDNNLDILIDAEVENRQLADEQLQIAIDAENTARVNLKINNVLDFGAIGDGTTDDTTAIQAAIDDAIENGKIVYFPCGKYLCSNLNVHDITLLGSGIYDGTRPYESGSILYITDNEHYGITVGNSTTIKGLGFYYPNQLGATETPLEYPATIKINPTPSFVMEDCIFYNSYNAIEAGNSNNASGKFTITNVYAYAVNKFCSLNYFLDSVHIDNCFITCGVGQDIALVGNKYLAKYTADHGVAFTLDRVDDFNIQESIIYGYYKAFLVVNGFTNMCKIIGVHMDAVGYCLHVTQNGEIQNMTFSNNQVFCINPLRSVTPYSCILLEGTLTQCEFKDSIFEGIPYRCFVASTSVNYLNIESIDAHNISDYFLVSNVVGRLIVRDNFIRPNTRNVPINVQNCAIVHLDGNHFGAVNAMCELENITYLKITNNMCLDDTNASVLSTIGTRMIADNLLNHPINASVTVDCGTLNANSAKVITANIAGLRIGDVVTLQPLNNGLLVSGVAISCSITESNKLNVCFRNLTASNIEVGPQGFYYTIS